MIYPDETFFAGACAGAEGVEGDTGALGRIENGGTIRNTNRDSIRLERYFMHVTEEEGFEPPVPYGTAVFKTAALNHSATPPTVFPARGSAPQRCKGLGRRWMRDIFGPFDFLFILF